MRKERQEGLDVDEPSPAGAGPRYTSSVVIAGMVLNEMPRQARSKAWRNVPADAAKADDTFRRKKRMSTYRKQQAEEVLTMLSLATPAATVENWERERERKSGTGTRPTCAAPTIIDEVVASSEQGHQGGSNRNT